jgi:predicted Rossmann fold flavoprotein
LNQKKQIVVIGGGAAGFFGAFRAAFSNPQAQITIVEKSPKLLSKVKISGGGRCNVTHYCFQPAALAANYPRGQKLLKQLFNTYGAAETCTWFEERGLPLVAEPDGRMFPVTNSSQSVIDLFLKESKHHNIEVLTSTSIESITKNEHGTFEIQTSQQKLVADNILIASGGAPKAESYEWIRRLGHSVEPPVPSLFTFNIPDKSLHELAGISVPQASVRIETTKLSYEGPLLITHWGLSGPAVLKLSAFGARWIYDQQYRFTIQVRWIREQKEEVVRQNLTDYARQNPKQQILKHPLFELPQRLWQYLCLKAGVQGEQRWLDISKKIQNRLLEVLYRDRYEVSGKTTFKEEFVTCGGVSLSEINPATMESRLVPGLFFAGEILDIDGITGGFNFQAAWTTAWIAGSNM